MADVEKLIKKEKTQLEKVKDLGRYFVKYENQAKDIFKNALNEIEHHTGNSSPKEILKNTNLNHRQIFNMVFDDVEKILGTHIHINNGVKALYRYYDDLDKEVRRLIDRSALKHINENFDDIKDELSDYLRYINKVKSNISSNKGLPSGGLFHKENRRNNKTSIRKRIKEIIAHETDFEHSILKILSILYHRFENYIQDQIKNNRRDMLMTASFQNS